MPRGRLSRHPLPLGTGTSKHQKPLPPTDTIPSHNNNNVKSKKNKCSREGIPSPPPVHCKATDTDTAPPSPQKTSPFVSPSDDCPQAMSTPRSAVDDFLLSQADHVVRWDTSSPDAYNKAKKVASKDRGRSTIQLLAAGIKREPMAESPTTPALVSFWLVRGQDVAGSDDATTTTPKSEQQRARGSRRTRALQRDRDEREVSANNLIKKLTDLMEQEREEEPAEAQENSSEDLTFSAAVGQLANLSADDDDIFNNSAIIQPSAVIHPIPIKRTPRSKNRTDDDDVTNRESQKENPLADSSWEDDDIFMNDDFLVQSSQLTDALYDPNTRRFRTPKATRNDQSDKTKTPLRNAMRNSASNINVGACMKKIPEETLSSRGTKPSTKIEASSSRSSKNVEISTPKKPSISKPLPNTSAGTPSVSNCTAKPVIKKLSPDARPIRSSQSSGNNNGASLDSRVIDRGSKPREVAEKRSEVFGTKLATGSLAIASCELDADTSVSDDILLRLAEPDAAWESRVDGGKNDDQLLWDDDDDDGDFGNLPLEAIEGTKPSQSPIPPTVILTPSPPQTARSRTLSYKPGLSAATGDSTRKEQSAPLPPPARSIPPAESAVAADAFDGDDDSFCQPDILAKLERVELEATQSLKASQSPAKSSQSSARSSQSPHRAQASQVCTANEIQRKKEAALKKRRLAQIGKDPAKKGKFL